MYTRTYVRIRMHICSNMYVATALLLNMLAKVRTKFVAIEFISFVHNYLVSSSAMIIVFHMQQLVSDMYVCR